jgi:uncharacterized protein YdeI (YjbR/CyaY-like superfamily)
MVKMIEEAYFSNRDDWRAWLGKNHDSKKEVWLIYYKNRQANRVFHTTIQLRKHCVLVG